jgi:hypothetical protein
MPPAAPLTALTLTKPQQDAIRRNCARDYRTNCAGVRLGGGAALRCLQRNTAKLSTACLSALAVIPPRPAAGAAPAAAAPAPAVPPPSSGAPATAVAPAAPPTSAPAAPSSLSPGQMLLVARACNTERLTMCSNTSVGQGNVVACLMRNESSLSSMCKDALASLTR